MQGSTFDSAGVLAPSHDNPSYVHFERFISLLLAVGLIMMWVATVLPVQLGTVTDGPDGRLLLTPVKTTASYAANSLGLLSMLAAGALSITSRNLRVIGFGAAAAFYVLMATAVVWAAVAYSPAGLLSAKIMSPTGPLVWGSLIILFAGIEPGRWRYIDPVIQGLAYVTALLAVHSIVSDTTYAFYHGYSQYIQYAILLTWLGGWTILSKTSLRGWHLVPIGSLYAVMLWNSLYAQSRSWLINTLVVAIVFGWRAVGSKSLHRAIIWLVVLLLVLAGIASGVWLLRPQTAQIAIEGFASRLGEDTRSGQYVDFFDDVEPEELVLGRGPNGTWYWKGVGPYHYFDNGYLWTLFIGGVPTLLTYLALVIVPGWRSAALRRPDADSAAATLVILWSIALTGLSTFTLPSLTVDHFLILLFVGRCYWTLHSRQQSHLFKRAPGALLASPIRISGERQQIAFYN